MYDYYRRINTFHIVLIPDIIRINTFRIVLIPDAIRINTFRIELIPDANRINTNVFAYYTSIITGQIKYNLMRISAHT